MATEFEVETTEEFESMLQTKDIRISEALVNTILNNLKGKNACKNVSTEGLGELMLIKFFFEN